ncbi:hypothetical protein LSH36_99g02010 [Paralvinella palmiformis]|uniref:Uncharacterized protein n=1 Tax=Paralvinella palmiformis TaxID=53620 RepID=A0AAD9K1J3_9ANNE|nr:hypothetical protein LSH36_99g02010 [Paralvinella palmiformis]
MCRDDNGTGEMYAEDVTKGRLFTWCHPGPEINAHGSADSVFTTDSLKSEANKFCTFVKMLVPCSASDITHLYQTTSPDSSLHLDSPRPKSGRCIPEASFGLNKAGQDTRQLDTHCTTTIRSLLCSQYVGYIIGQAYSLQFTNLAHGTAKSGIPVDVNRPRYFVLTFVLCGVILGIVLSVIAIYIVRRHLQSKEKLAQLSTTTDGVEASSDYQDLCRQRMQSKSSERPEPLHISSRVGSVSASEGAVRSPSSRSSTSSRYVDCPSVHPSVRPDDAQNRNSVNIQINIDKHSVENDSANTII